MVLSSSTNRAAISRLVSPSASTCNNSCSRGLSYTNFNYSKKLVVTPAADGGFDVQVTVRNVGSMDGDEVVQVYLGAGQVPAGVQMAEKALVGFERVSLKRGQTQAITIHIAPRPPSARSPRLSSRLGIYTQPAR